MHTHMQADVYFWHYLIVGIVFAVLGALGHVSRAVFNIFPDRLSDKPWMDMMLSSGYSFGDYLFGTEYDEAGYYKLDSLKNLRMHVVGGVGGGLLAMLIVPDFAGFAAWSINQACLWLWELFLYRLTDIHLF